jgi:hypothetical protein
VESWGNRIPGTEGMPCHCVFFRVIWLIKNYIFGFVIIWRFFLLNFKPFGNVVVEISSLLVSSM